MPSRTETGLIQKLLLGLPLRKSFFLGAGLAILLLLTVTLLGIKQYLLYQHCDKVVAASRRLLFQFSTIQEIVNETLIVKRTLQFKDINDEIEALENDIATIVDDVLIPEQYRQGFISQSDLVGLVVKLRTIQQSTETPTPEQLTSTIGMLRALDGRISQFHQGITTYTQGLLLGLHTTLAGFLALALSVISILFFLVNRFLTRPILQLNEQANISTLIDHLSQNRQQQAESIMSGQCGINNSPSLISLSSMFRFAAIGHLTTGLAHELTNLSNGAINYSQALLDLSDDSTQGTESKALLEKLLLAEKKISALAVELQKIMGDTKGDNRPYSFSELIQPIEILSKGQMKTEGIELHVSIAPGLPMISTRGKDLQMVMLSLLHKSRIRIGAKYPSGRHEHKNILINATALPLAHDSTENPQPTQSRIQVHLQDFGIPWQPSATGQDSGNEVSSQCWLAVQLCQEFLHNIGGNLMVESSSDQNNTCTIIFPC